MKARAARCYANFTPERGKSSTMTPLPPHPLPAPDAAPGHPAGPVVLLAIPAQHLADVVRRLGDDLPEGCLVLAPPGPPAAAGSPGAALTPRQGTILGLVAQGLSNKEIGRTLGLSHFTVRNHVSQVLRLLGVTDRRAAGQRLALPYSGGSAPVLSASA